MDSRPRTRAPLAVLALAALLIAAFSALGGWQLARRSWKLDLIARVDARVHAPPVAAPARAQWPGIGAARDEYRHVRLQGRWLPGHETLVQAVTELGPGYWVLTPLQTADGIVLVNRGFVAPEQRAAAQAGLGLDAAPVVVTGLLRMDEPGGTWLRRNEPAAQRWVSRDVQAIAAARGLGAVAPYFVDADAAPAGAGAATAPVGGLTVIVFRNNHLVYALTWFSLAALTAVCSVALLHRGAAERAR